MPEETLNLAQAAQRLGISYGAMYRLTTGGEISLIRVGTRWGVHTSDVDAYRRSRRRLRWAEGPHGPGTDELLSAREVAARLGVSLRGVQRAAERGYLRAEKVDGAWMIREEDLVGLAPVTGRLRQTKSGHPAIWMPGYISAADAARRLGVGPAYVGVLVRRGRLEAVRIGAWVAVREESVAEVARRREGVEEDAETKEIRRLVLAGACPWCGRTGLRIPAGHVSRLHGIDSRQLRRLMGVRADTPISAAEITERQRLRNARPEHLAQVRAMTPRGGPGSRPAATPIVPERRAVTAEPRPPRKRIGPLQRQRVIALRESGLTYRAIGETEGLGEVTVLRICRGYR